MKQRINTLSDNAGQSGDLMIGGKKVMKITSIEIDAFSEHGFNINNNNSLTIYKNVTIKCVKYTSQQSKEISTIDYFVRLKDNGQIWAIEYYTIIENILYALVNRYEVIETHAHFIQIKKTDHHQLIKMAQIEKNDLSQICITRIRCVGS